MVDERAVERFLYKEARLADENRLDEWLALWADDPDATYWVPCNKDDVDPRRELSIIYDNRDRLNLRIERLKTGMAWTQEPPSRMRRLIANIEVEEGQGDEIIACANFHITELRVNTGLENIWVGRTEHRLRPEAGSFRIVFKKVMLVNNDEEMSQLSFLI
ncbi:MAG TPA: aromatic-ring-hydroxylating dioxygenase subunit beta [Dehalococcoidia bacterium]|nr:aromatic-ring-hydroxylating dioxygenase subunit beta [Dehalococcoidia bacterium]